MEIIQLQNPGEDWRIHRFNNEQDRDAELARRGIEMGSNVRISPYVMIGDKAVIGNNVELDEECVVSARAVLGDNTRLGQRAFVGEDSQMGRNCSMAEDSFIGDFCTVESNVNIGQRSEIGSGSRVGNAVSVDRCSYIMDGCTIEDGTTIGSGVYIGTLSKTGYFVKISDDAQLLREVMVQDGANIAQGKRIPPYANVSRRDVQLETERMQRAIERMKETLRYEQLATYVSLEGKRCVRACIDGIWMPSARVNESDSKLFREGQMTLKQMADKYIAPSYLIKNIESETISGGMRR